MSEFLSNSNIDGPKVGLNNLNYLVNIHLENKVFKTPILLNIKAQGIKKDVHSSVLIEAIENHKDNFFIDGKEDILLKEIERASQSDFTGIDYGFKYFMDKVAPVSKKRSQLIYRVKVTKFISKDKHRTYLSILLPIISTCPSSKRVSRFGAHTQRSKLTISFEYSYDEKIDIDPIIRKAEEITGGSIYTLTTEEDEQEITESSYQWAKSIDTVINEVYRGMRSNLNSLNVSCINYESIYNHNLSAGI